MCETRDIADAKCLSAGFAQCRGENEAGRDPRKTGDAEIGECRCQQKSRENGQRKAASQECAGRKFLQPRQLASNVPKRKFWGSTCLWRVVCGVSRKLRHTIC
jgi:hypothetical protein